MDSAALAESKLELQEERAAQGLSTEPTPAFEVEEVDDWEVRWHGSEQGRRVRQDRRVSLFSTMQFLPRKKMLLLDIEAPSISWFHFPITIPLLLLPRTPLQPPNLQAQRQTSHH